jgi:hypothetical protein
LERADEGSIRAGEDRFYGGRMRIAVAMLLIAAGVAGCGSDIELQSDSGALARAEASTRELGSVRLRTTVRGIVGGVPVRARGHGAIDFSGRRVSVTMVGSSDGREFEYEMISEEHAIYTRVGSEWTVDRSKLPGGPTRKLALVGARDPAAQLALLAYVKNVGVIRTEKVGGVATTRYGGEIDLPGYQIEPVDFWVDDQWRIRRLRTLTIGGNGRQIVTTEFYDYGARIAPIVPPKLD